MLWSFIKNLFSGKFTILVDENINASKLRMALREQYEYNEDKIEYVYNYKNLADDLHYLSEKAFSSTSEIFDDLLEIFESNLLEFEVDNIFIKRNKTINGTYFEFVFFANGSFFNLGIGFSEEEMELFLL